MELCDLGILETHPVLREPDDTNRQGASLVVLLAVLWSITGMSTIMDAKQKEAFILEYFKQLRVEINLRIKNHTTLVTLKVMTIGALFAFLLTEEATTLEKFRSYGLLVVPAMAMLFDIMICQNTHMIHLLAVYIRDHIESRVDVVELWEGGVTQKISRKRCYAWADGIVSGVLTLGTHGVVLYVIWRSTGRIGAPLWLLTVAYTGVVVFKMKKTIVHSASPSKGSN